MGQDLLEKTSYEVEYYRVCEELKRAIKYGDSQKNFSEYLVEKSLKLKEENEYLLDSIKKIALMQQDREYDKFGAASLYEKLHLVNDLRKIRNIARDCLIKYGVVKP